MAGLRDNKPRITGTRVAPAANPHMHSSWNSNNPKSSSMEFHTARGRQINHRRWEAVNHKQVTQGGTGKDSNTESSAEGGGGGW